MRELSNRFIGDLQDGILLPLAERVRRDNTLMLAIRNGYVNIYYRGGSILKIEERKTKYVVTFNENYDSSLDKQRIQALLLPDALDSIEETNTLVGKIPLLKEIMDYHFTANPKEEREYQQVVVRENNNSSISNETEYFIIDIEIADASFRFDLSGIFWDAGNRQHISKCRPSFIEMKYGDSSLGGSAGMLKHLSDMEAFTSNRSQYELFVKAMEVQFKQLDALKLFRFNHTTNVELKLNPNDKPQFIFLLANHNPRASKLKSILTDPVFQKKAKSASFELLFSTTTFAGYGLHSRTMLTLDQMIASLSGD
jgi:hypothetical protein